MGWLKILQKALRGLGKDERNTLHNGNTNLAMRIACARIWLNTMQTQKAALGKPNGL
jgi:hypothetical protein